MEIASANIVTNRPAGYDEFVAQLSLAVDSPNPEPISIILADLDWFGRMNSERGRSAGDSVIVRLRDYLVDRAPATARVFRYGGDAFMVLMPGMEKEQAFLVAEELRRGVGAIQNDPASAALTFSCGVAAFPDDGATVPALLRKVSEALYRAKLGGRDRVALAREEKMVTKTVHYTQGQLDGLSRLAKREEVSEAALLREALDDLLRKHNS